MEFTEPTIVDSEDGVCAYDDEGWIRSGPSRKNRRPNRNKSRPILRCSAAQRPDGRRPPAGLSDIVADDDLDTMRRKFNAARDYFHHSGSGRKFFHALLDDINQAVSSVAQSKLGPQSIDVLCLGLGNPAVDQASLRQLAVLDLLLERDGRFARMRTRLYDPVFRATSRAFIHELGMQVLETNEEACYPLAPEHYHFVMLPHCAPALVNNLLYANWNRELLGRVILFSNSWLRVRHELAATGEPEALITRELAYMHALEPAIVVADRVAHTQQGNKFGEERDFEGMRVQWFPPEKLALLPPVTWTEPCGGDLKRLVRQPEVKEPVHPKMVSSSNCFYADLIGRELIASFVDSSDI